MQNAIHGVVLNQIFQIFIFYHRNCQRHINIPLLLWLGAFVEPVRSPHKNNPPKARSCVCAGGLPSAPQNKQQHMKRKASLQLCMCSNEGACSVGSFACICIDTELILHCWSSKTVVVMFPFHVTSRGIQIWKTMHSGGCFAQYNRMWKNWLYIKITLTLPWLPPGGGLQYMHINDIP